MQPSFNFDKYEILSCSYSRNEVDGEYQGAITFEPIIQRAEEDPRKFRVEIKTVLTGLADIELVIAGYFTSTGLLKEEETEDAIVFSGLYLLMPYIRSFIHTISCQDGRAPITIPVINVEQLLSAPEIGN